MTTQCVEEEEAIDFTTDQNTWDELGKLVIKEGPAGHREEIWATFTGVLRAPKSYIMAEGRVVGGYGHLGYEHISMWGIDGSGIGVARSKFENGTLFDCSVDVTKNVTMA